MSKPIDRKRQKRNYTYFAIGGYLLVIYFGCHFGYVMQGRPISPEVLLECINHALSEPLTMFPTDIKTVATFALAGLLVPMLVHSDYLKHRDLRPNEESGSAKWNDDLKTYNKKYTELAPWLAVLQYNKRIPNFIRKLLRLINNVLLKIPVISFFYKGLSKIFPSRNPIPDQTPGSKNMILSKDVYLSMNGRKTRRNCNTLIIGGSGTGKSRFEVKPNILQANCSFVITDPSGELLESTGSFLLEEGYDVRVFNLVEMDHSCCYNPFNYIRDQKGVYSMINALIKNTTPKGSNTNDPFWEKAETALLQAICFYLVSECNKEDQNFSNVMKLLRCAKAAEGQEDVDSTLDILFKDLEERESEHIAVQSYKVFKSAGGGKTAQSILISCQTRLQTFNLDDIKNLTSIDNIDLGSIGDKKTALFCITSSDDPAYNYLVALMYTQLFETLSFYASTKCKGKRLPVHVRFLLDEFARKSNLPKVA